MLRRQLDPANRWFAAPSLAAAATQLASAETPSEVVLLAQPRPGCDDQTAVDRLHAVAPLTRVVVVAGAWCEGELRTGRVLTGVLRLYWHELVPWWRDALARLAQGASPPWSAPLDNPRATRLPHVNADIGEDPLQRSGPLWTVAIDASDYAVFEALETALAPHGWKAMWTPRHRATQHDCGPFHAAIWDGSQLAPRELQRLAQFFANLPFSRDAESAQWRACIALLDFPRPEHLEMAHAAGADGRARQTVRRQRPLISLGQSPVLTIRSPLELAGRPRCPGSRTAWPSGYGFNRPATCCTHHPSPNSVLTISRFHWGS